jgi:hypothetical protein
MATNNLKVTELDFDRIKENLKSYLKDPSVNTEFQDYDFDASGLNILLDILSYNTHYNSYYLNMVANEAFLDTALLRNSVVSHAKSLGYTPYSAKSPAAIVNVTAQSENNNLGTLTIPYGYNLFSEQIDGTSYNFVVLEDVLATKANSSYVFENVRLQEGQLISYRFAYNEQTNPLAIFTLPDDNIDISTLRVLVYPSETSSEFSVYKKNLEVLDLTSSSEIYFLQESREEKYQIYFGNDVIGKKLPNGAVIVTSYLVTNGELANKANNFVMSSTLADSLSEQISVFTVEPVSESAGGSSKETIDSIRKSALAQYSTQNRLVTYNDYESYLISNYPALDSISVWGGEEETPPVFGKVFISLKPKDNYFLSELEKSRIIDEIIKPKSIISVDPVIKEPELLYLKVENRVKYDPNKTIVSQESLKSSIRDTVINYFNTNVNKFNATFVLSKLQEDINNVEMNSIIGVETNLRLEKRFKPQLNVRRRYDINFNTELFRGSVINKLFSSEFDTFDNNGVRRRCQIEEVPEAFTGISDIIITNPGSGYVTPPTVTITGDGSGATAVAKIVNGRVESIDITNRGVNYSRALIRIDGGSGFGATAVVILDSRFGILRTVFFNENAERQIINPSAGTINYDTGEVIINNLNILSTYTTDDFIRINVQSQNEIINSIKNNIITIDLNDSDSIITNLSTL